MDCWESTPRIAFLSPEPGCGKTRALEVTELLVPRPVEAVNVTPAYLFRKVCDPDGPPTILYDEIDTVFGPKAKDNEEIRGMLNAGHRNGRRRRPVRGARQDRRNRGDPGLLRRRVGRARRPARHAACRASVVVADATPGADRTRSSRAGAASTRPRREAARSARALGELVARPGRRHWPEMPDGVADRDADVWEALLAVADLAGGHWPDTARVAAVTLVTASKGRTPSLGVLLLHDIQTVFNNRGADRLSTEVLLTDLKGMEESPWAVIRRGEPLDARGLSQRLRKYDIKPDLQRIGDEVLRGYTRAQFADAWSRYLHTESVTSVTEVTFTAGRSAPSDLCESASERLRVPIRGVCDFCTVKRHRQAAGGVA